MKTTDHELALEPGRERLISLAQLRERPFDHIHRIRPPEQRRVRFGDLESDRPALSRIVREPQRLLQVHARRLAPCARLRASRLTQYVASICKRGRLSQRAAEQAGRGLRRAAVHRRPRGLAQATEHPAIARRPHADKMCSDLSRRGPVRVKQTGGTTMRRVALVAAQRCLDCVVDNRVNESRTVIGCQHLEPNEAGGQSRGVRHLHAGDRRRVAQLAAVPEHGERLGKPQRVRIKAANAGKHPQCDPLTPANQKLVRLKLGQPLTVELHRPQQLGHIQRIAASRRPHRRAQPIARPPTNRVADNRAHGALAQKPRPHHRQRLRTQRKRRSSHRRRLTGPQRDEDPQRHPLQARRQIRQPPQRRLIHPLRIINGDQQRPTVCEIGSQPVQAVQNRKRRVIGRRPEELSQQQRSRRASRAGEQRLALVQVGAQQAPLKQLTHHPNAKSASSAEPRARRTSCPSPTARRHAASTSEVFPIPTPPSITRTPPPRSNSSATAANSRSRSSSFSTKITLTPISGDQHGPQSATVVLGVAKRQHHQEAVPLRLPRRQVRAPTRRPARHSLKTKTNRAKQGLGGTAPRVRNHEYPAVSTTFDAASEPAAFGGIWPRARIRGRLMARNDVPPVSLGRRSRRWASATKAQPGSVAPILRLGVR